MTTNLHFVFSDLYNDVSRLLGTYGSSGPSGVDLTEAKDIVNNGYRRFLNAYKWSFLMQTDRITTTSGDWEYLLPENFSVFVGTPHFDKEMTYHWLMQKDYGDILEFRASNEYTSYPEYYALRLSDYTPQTGQRWLIALYPTPESAYTLLFQYRVNPPKLENDSDIPIGPADLSDAIRACCLAEAEKFMDEAIGTQEQNALRALQDAIRKDISRQPATLGYFGDGGDYISPESITRGEFRINSVTYTVD